MSISIGIDTGGTYTDLAVYDDEVGKVIFKSKSLTTREDLAIGITNALDTVPLDLAAQASSLSLSTTLATNACVEGKGGKAKLVLLGLPQSTFTLLDPETKYGISEADTLCIDTNGSFDGSVIDEPDWEQVWEENREFFDSAQSLAFSEINALRNSAVVEQHARDFFRTKYDIPIVLASDLANKLNFIERGATAVLNARLLPVISEFVSAVGRTLEERDMDIPVMILRSDGSLMSKESSQDKPVETILSGPAASVIGGRNMADCRDCLIIDTGGTTTDISIVEAGEPVMADSIRIGGWRTQVRGVFIDTYGLGGDSRVYNDKDNIAIAPNRVVPLCILADQHPEVIDDLEALVAGERKSVYPMHEFLYILKEPKDDSEYTDEEKRLLDTLSDGPVMLGDPRIDIYRLKSQRLEEEGILMRAGLTPTDVMHVKGDFTDFNVHASELGVRHFANSLHPTKDRKEREAAFWKVCDQIYALVKRKMHHYIMNALMEYRYSKIMRSCDTELMDKLIDQYWDDAIGGNQNPLYNLGFEVDAVLVGIGAPTHLFLPDVAKALGTECVIPENAEVACAVGAATSDISVEVVVKVDPIYDGGGLREYKVRSTSGDTAFTYYEPAVEFAKERAREAAVAEARRRGALGELQVGVRVEEQKVSISFDDSIRLGIEVIGTARDVAV